MSIQSTIESRIYNATMISSVGDLSHSQDVQRVMIKNQHLMADEDKFITCCINDLGNRNTSKQFVLQTNQPTSGLRATFQLVDNVYVPAVSLYETKSNINELAMNLHPNDAVLWSFEELEAKKEAVKKEEIKKSNRTESKSK